MEREREQENQRVRLRRNRTRRRTRVDPAPFHIWFSTTPVRLSRDCFKFNLPFSVSLVTGSLSHTTTEPLSVIDDNSEGSRLSNYGIQKRIV